MKHISQQQFAEFIGVSLALLKNWRSKCLHNVPEPMLYKKVKCSNKPAPFWSQIQIIKFKRHLKESTKAQTLDYDLVKSLSDSGMFRKEMAKILNTTVNRLNFFCTKNGILSKRTQASREKARKQVEANEYNVSSALVAAVNSLNIAAQTKAYRAERS